MRVYAFVDMHSGGRTKVPGLEVAFIHAPDEEAARSKFEREVGRDPDHVTCRCCGPDYALMEYDGREDWPFQRPGDEGTGVHT